MSNVIEFTKEKKPIPENRMTKEIKELNKYEIEVKDRINSLIYFIPEVDIADDIMKFIKHVSNLFDNVKLIVMNRDKLNDR